VFDGTNFTTTGTTTSSGYRFSYNTGLFTTDGTLSNYSAANSVYLNGNVAGALVLNGSGNGNQKIVVQGTTNSYIQFFTSNSESMRLDSGNLLVGTTTTDGTNTGGFALLTPATSSQLYIGHISGTGSGAAYLAFNYNGTGIGSISQSGTTAVAYNTTSDYRLKENVVPIAGALAKVAALKPCTYTWKSAPDEIGEGFIAHELAEVCHQAVTGEKDAVDEDGNPKYQGIDTSFLVATLTAAIQEQQALITSLTARLDAANL
jgi:hypothetical protein